MTTIPIRRPGPNATLRGVLAGLPDATIAVLFLLAWTKPLAMGPGFVRTMFGLFVYEIVALLAGGVLLVATAIAVAYRRWAVGIAVGLLAIGFVGWAAKLALAFGSNWPYLALGGLLAAKLTPLLFRDVDVPTAAATFGTFVGALCLWLMLAMMSAFVHWPELGLDAEARATLSLPGTGRWVTEPYRPIASGFAYFTLVALLRGVLTHNVFRQAAR